jgi:hypothetical protein
LAEKVQRKVRNGVAQLAAGSSWIGKNLSISAMRLDDRAPARQARLIRH